MKTSDIHTFSTKAQLKRFAEALFERNPFQETPFLRGIYFASGRQEGDTLPTPPPVLHDFKIEFTKRPDTHLGLFLHDFFAKILPGDRRLYSPLFEFVRWRKLTHVLGMTAALAVIFCCIGLFTFSYIKNRQALTEFIEDFDTVPKLSNDLRRDLIVMDNYREQLLRMQVLNRDWLLPRLGYNQSLYAQGKLERLYCDLFRNGLLAKLDLMLRQNIAALNPDSPEQQLTRYIAHVVGRINLLDAELKGASPKQLQQMPMPDERVFSQVEANMLPEVADFFDRLYLTYLELTRNQTYLVRERKTMMDFLRSVLRARQTELYWLVDWANDQPDLEGYGMPQFWGLTAQSPDDTASVPPAYTDAGKKRIDAFIARVESALDNDNVIDARVQNFKLWYVQQYANTWQTFATHFPDGENWERTYLEWKSLASTMAGENNPYFKLMRTMGAQLQPIAKEAAQNAPWVNTVTNFAKLQDLDDQRDVAQAESDVMRGIDTGKKLLSALAGADSQNATQAGDASTAPSVAAGQGAGNELQQRASLLDAVKTYDNYEKALADILPATMAGDAALNMASGFFKAEPDPSKSSSPFNSGYVAITKMEHLISPAQSNDAFVWDVIGGPLRFLMDFTIIEAAREIQTQYESIVLAAVNDAPKSKLPTLLFDKQSGAAWKFADGPAQAFLGRNANGYFARAAYGKRFPFDDQLFRFLEQGAAEIQVGQDQYEVTIKGFPTDTNQGSVKDPYATLLSVDCAPKPFTLENLNYPQETDVIWKPGQCGDTVFTIKFDGFDLTKRYSGGMGFPKFLRDFQYGTRVFKPEDFPDQKDNLALLNISEIIVSYSITGSSPVIQLLQRKDITVPQVIVEPWVF